MSPEQIIRAWKDEEYRQSLSEAELAQLPENPVGLVQLADEEAASIAGGTWSLTGTCDRRRCPSTWYSGCPSWDCIRL
jgi:mersacidin/lichenicidin family type 2 lantibiotic